MLKKLYQKLLPSKIRYHLFHLRKTPALKIYQTILPVLDTNVAQLSNRMQSLHNQYQGQPCFVFGNGPSLNKMDLSLFKGQHIWASNRFYLIFDQIDWRPDFYVGVDKRVIPDVSMELSGLQHRSPDTKFFFPVEFRERKYLHSLPNTYWFREEVIYTPGKTPIAFSPDCSKELAQPRTVTATMIQLAVYLGFNPIYLVGCDTSYSINKTVVREEENQDYLVSTQDDDPNHFHPGYFGTGKKWHHPHVERMIAQYEQVKIACDALGVQVYNATLGGNLEVFPRIDYHQALK